MRCGRAPFPAAVVNTAARKQMVIDDNVELNRFAAAFLVYLAEPRFLGRGFFHAQRAKSDFFEDHGIV